MKDKRWERIESLFHMARELKAEDRSRFLEQACGADAALRREVEVLLRQHEKSDSFLNSPLVDTIVAPNSSAITPRPHESKGVAPIAGQARINRKSERLSVRPRAPWWVWLVAASFALDFALFNYLDFAGPILGARAAPTTSGGVFVTEIYPGAPAAVAGLQSGDRIRRVDGLLIGSYLNWAAVLFNLKVDEPRTFEIQRGNETLTLSVVPKQRWFLGYEGPSLLGHVLWRIGQLVMLGLACFLASARPRNRSAVIASLFFAGLSLSNVPETMTGVYAMLRQLPTVLFALFYISWVARGLTAPLFFTFCATFPRPLLHSRRLWMLIWMPYLLMLAPLEVLFNPVIFDSHHAIGTFSIALYNGLNASAGLYFVAGMIAVVANYRRLTDVNERRRIRVVVFGSVVGLLALLALTPYYLLFRQPGFRDTFFGAIFLSPPVLITSVIFSFFVFPLSFVYSILRHRLFDVRIIIRQGLQYAMARSVMLSIIPLLASVFLAEMFVERDQSLTAVLKMRGWVYGTLGVFAAIVYRKRREWLEQIDRRFFRDRFDAQHLLQDVIQDIKQAKSVETTVSGIISRIEEALHPEFIALLRRDVGQTEFRSIVCVPDTHTPPQLRPDSRVLALVRVLEKPLQFSASTWLSDRLPQDEMESIEEQRVELLVPIALGSDAAESLLVLGPKRSEEPYSREDEKLLSTIAASLALIPAKAANDEHDTQNFRECPDCGVCFDAAESRCRREGSVLVRVDMPRLLAKRYRLERRVGQGGMGAVYSGTDQALARPVAIKVIRPELLGNPDLTARFHQEARAAAGLVHRNVVTIHDFGMEGKHPFIVMELLEGRTLRTELDSGKPLSSTRTLEILEGVCSALDNAHRRQLLHRDLKPANIFLAQTPTGEVVKILDFGLVKILGESLSDTAESASMIAGTPSYMAPELLLGHAPSKASDVWALGVIAYEMLTRELPFSDVVPDRDHGRLSESFTQLHFDEADLSVHLQPFLERVFQRDPARRISSARVFYSELELALRRRNFAAQTPH